MKIVFLFPGQGSQILGMGRDLYVEYDFVRKIFEITDDITKNNITNLCFNGPMKLLKKTVNLQPAITAVSLACLSIVEKFGIKCSFALGHSLGEYSALQAAKILSLSDTIRAVYKRGTLMGKESKKKKGFMYAIIGFPVDHVKSVIKHYKMKGKVFIAAYNLQYQIVISGEIECVKKISRVYNSLDAKVIPINSGGGWHCDMMKKINKEFSSFLDKLKFNTPICKVIHNVGSNTVRKPQEIKSLLIKQLYEPVLWYDSLNKVMNNNPDIFVELGPGTVLSGILKKILPNNRIVKIFNVSNMKSLENFMCYIL